MAPEKYFFAEKNNICQKKKLFAVKKILEMLMKIFSPFEEILHVFWEILISSNEDTQIILGRNIISKIAD